MHKPILVIALLTLIAAPGCAAGGETSTPQEATEVSINEEFVLGLGETADVVGEEMLVTFANVVSDNRCPEGAQCIEAGEIVCLLEIHRGGTIDSLSVTERGLFPDQSIEYLDYVIVFHVTPYPEMGKEILPGDYRLRLTFRLA